MKRVIMEIFGFPVEVDADQVSLHIEHEELTEKISSLNRQFNLVSDLDMRDEINDEMIALLSKIRHIKDSLRKNVKFLSRGGKYV